VSQSKTFETALARSRRIENDLSENPQKYRVLTGDRPTGSLHIGHLFGSLENRVKLQKMGVECFIVIADYQVLTDRNSVESISENVKELVLDYLAVGIDPKGGNSFIFPHSSVPALNQLFVPFLGLVSMSELDRNPTIQEEIQAAGLRNVSAAMYTYPIHQAADILFCNGNLIPVGKDQLPHLELARKIARRFNKRFCAEAPIFRPPEALMSETPSVLGLDGGQKMSKSRNNAIFLKNSEDETAKLIKTAKTDSVRRITYDPSGRPEVSSLLRILSLVTSEDAVAIADRIGDKGSGKLKSELTDALNSYLRPMRQRRRELQDDPDIVKDTLRHGVARATLEAESTLNKVRSVMNMDYSADD